MYARNLDSWAHMHTPMSQIALLLILPSLMRARPSLTSLFFAKLDGILIKELMWRNLQVLGCRSLANTAAVIIVRSVAGAEVSAIIARIWLRNAAEVGADTDADQPLGLLASLSVSGWLTHGGCND
eukprot:CAMPEP_0197633480 /NCGR_PEP_ID=MMETSP1338-20131121/9839_1 /TAXON_ID=43686 ORGANISM="Pelagodinium beii, Strain RCC1491" /NCGR_SAMPLE_ID=MMETSP1338 /ASSEMBLY_ACC=CAM_ASM_000754 /LENGTH=125 /DNA_ID=CAMNT_0043205151 /DNA_START=17 /DNA_END=392 /DNA_ORIENTATION=-